MWDELACRISGCSERTGKLVAQDNPETTVIPTDLTTTNKSPRTVQANLLQNYEQKFANLPEHFQLIKICSNVGTTKTVTRTVFPDTRRSGTGQIWSLMSRVLLTSRQRSIQSERMDPWKHKNRSSFAGRSQSSPRPLRNRDHDRIPIW